jgi:hypothetical protein
MQIPPARDRTWHRAIGSWSNASANRHQHSLKANSTLCPFSHREKGSLRIFQTLPGDQVDGVFAAAFLSEASFNSRDSFSTR